MPRSKADDEGSDGKPIGNSTVPVVGIGASAGGLTALESLLPAIRKDIVMLSTLLIVLLILWLLGMVTSYTLGGFIHILLVVAIVVVLLRVIQGRNPLRG